MSGDGALEGLVGPPLLTDLAYTDAGRCIECLNGMSSH